MAIFHNRTTHNISKTYYLVNQVVMAVVKRKFKECSCRDYPNNTSICPHCLFQEKRLDKISTDSKVRFIYDFGKLAVVNSTPYTLLRSNGEPYRGNFCDVCGRSDMELSTIRNLKVCPICRHAHIRW